MLQYIDGAALSLIQVTTFLVSGAALFRVGTFIHEIVHMSGRTMVGFRVAWNVVCGVPLLMHSLLYSNHLDHHNPRKHGTPADGEYLPLASAPTRETVLYFAQVPVLPLLAVVRFLVLVPLSFSIPASGDGCSSGGLLMQSTHTTAAHPAYGTSASLDCTGRSVLPVVGRDSYFGAKGFLTWTMVGLFYCLSTYSLG